MQSVNTLLIRDLISCQTIIARKSLHEYSFVNSGVILDKPFKLVGMHVQGGGPLDRNYNFGASVKHIEFVRAYLVMVLPHLQKNI